MKTYMKFMTATISVILIMFIIFCIGLGVRLKHDAEAQKQAMKRFIPGTAEYETYKRWDQRADKYYSYIKNAKSYIEKKEYDYAIREYTEALKMNYNEWMTHRDLVDVYEKAGYYDLALQEIDWLLSRKKVDKRIVDELLVRKAKISSSSRGKTGK